MRIRAKLRAMAASEISEMIPPDVLRDIKQKDPSPIFRAFVVGHEGEARGNLVGIGNIVKQWFKSAIEKLHGKISAGIKLFSGHAETNETEGRIPIGEVVAKKLMQVKDKLSSVVACYVYPDFRHLPFDVASVEADISLEQNEEGNFVVADTDQVTGIALGNSEIDKPGFSGATLLGELQAMAEEKGITLKSESRVKRLLRINEPEPSEKLRLV